MDWAYTMICVKKHYHSWWNIGDVRSLCVQVINNAQWTALIHFALKNVITASETLEMHVLCVLMSCLRTMNYTQLTAHNGLRTMDCPYTTTLCIERLKNVITACETLETCVLCVLMLTTHTHPFNVRTHTHLMFANLQHTKNWHCCGRNLRLFLCVWSYWLLATYQISR